MAADSDAYAEELRTRLDEISGAISSHAAWLVDIQRGIDDVRVAHGTQLTDLGKWLNSTVLAVSAMSTVPIMPSPLLQASGAPARRLDEAADLRRLMQIWTVSEYLRHAPLGDLDLRVSVIMPTRNRLSYLKRAVASVLTQSYPHLELIVVDDGSSDGTADFLGGVTDGRVRVLRTPGRGEAASRNLALDHATGELVAYLDDDNLMDEGWLRAVAWAFDRWPATNLLYGARIVEDAAAVASRPSGSMPSLEWYAWDRRRLEMGNFIDMNVVAHRAGLPACRFDEDLQSSIDWQLVLNMTGEHDPLELPAVACVYGTYAPDRVCDTPVRLEHNRIVRARTHKSRPMRVLAHNAMFPLISETYIHEEMSALEAQGARIGFSAAQHSISPFPIEQPLWHDLDEAVAALDPDLIVLYWATHAAGELASIERTDRPFAVRVHSFDFDPELIDRLRAHPASIGVWAFPHQLPSLAEGHGLVPIFHSHEMLLERADVTVPAARDLVLSVSAGLPKKSWPVLLAALDRLNEYERGIVVARSNGLEQTVTELGIMVSNLSKPPFLEVNLPRSEVFELLSRTSVLIYTLEDGLPVGMPMSLIEALCAGSCVVHPDREEFHSVVGPGFRPYRTVDDIVVHVREIMAGGPRIDEERRANRAWAVANFCDPELGRRFHTEISDALEAWRLANS